MTPKHEAPGLCAPQNSKWMALGVPCTVTLASAMELQCNNSCGPERVPAIAAAVAVAAAVIAVFDVALAWITTWITTRWPGSRGSPRDDVAKYTIF